MVDGFDVSCGHAWRSRNAPRDRAGARVAASASDCSGARGSMMSKPRSAFATSSRASPVVPSVTSRITCAARRRPRKSRPAAASRPGRPAAGRPCASSDSITRMRRVSSRPFPLHVLRLAPPITACQAIQQRGLIPLRGEEIEGPATDNQQRRAGIGVQRVGRDAAPCDVHPDEHLAERAPLGVVLVAVKALLCMDLPRLEAHRGQLLPRRFRAHLAVRPAVVVVGAEPVLAVQSQRLAPMSRAALGAQPGIQLLLLLALLHARQHPSDGVA